MGPVPSRFSKLRISTPTRTTTRSTLENGTSLRSDFHTLFDLDLLTVTAGFLIAVGPELPGAAYERYCQQRLRLPDDFGTAL